MSSLFNSLSEELFQILKGSGKTLTLYTATGNKTYEPKNARRVFAEPDKMMISVNEAGSDSEVKLYLSQNVDLENVSKLINTLRQISTRYNVLFNVRKFGRELTPKDFAYQAEPMSEAAMWGSTKTSYQRIGETKLIVRHCVPVREGVIGSRARNILNMFVETKEGERLKFPVIHLSGARAFAQHLNQGGKAHDEFGSAIVELAQESSDLAKMNRYIHHARNILGEDAIALRPFIKMRINELRSTFMGLSRPRGYGRIVEAGLPSSMAMLCESANGIDNEVSRLAEMLKVDSNHALAKALTPVALLTLGVNMTNNITEMFHGVLTVEAADSLLEALADEYGYTDDSWLKMGSQIGFTDAAVFEAAQEYLGLIESDFAINENTDAFGTYARDWMMMRNRVAGEPEELDKEQEAGVGELSSFLKGFYGHGAPEFSLPDYPEQVPTYRDPTAEQRFMLGLFVDQFKLGGHASYNFVSAIIDKMAEGKKLDAVEKKVGSSLVKALKDDLSGGEDGVEESYYSSNPYDDEEGNGAAVEKSIEYFEDNFSGEGFLADSDYSGYVDGSLGDIDKEDAIDPKYFISGIAHQIVQALEDDDIVGYDTHNTFIISTATELFNQQVKPVLLQHGWTLNEAVKEFATEDGERHEGHGISVGDFVATDMGPGQVEEVSGDIAVVVFQNGRAKKMHVDSMDKVNEVASPEEAALQEWFDSFDATKLLAPVNEDETGHAEGDEVSHRIYGAGTVVGQNGKFVKVKFNKPHSRLPASLTVSLDPRIVDKKVEKATLARKNDSELTELSPATKDSYFTRAAMDRGAAEKSEVVDGDEHAGKRREKRDRGLARLLRNSMVDEAASDVYFSVFAQNSDGSWSHYFDADDKEDAADSKREVIGMGDKAVVIKVPKDQANWTHVNPDEFVKNHLAKKAAPAPVAAPVEEAAHGGSDTLETSIIINDWDVDVIVHYSYDDGSFATGLDYPANHSYGDNLYIDQVIIKETGLEITDELDEKVIDRLKQEITELLSQPEDNPYESADMSKDLVNDVKVDHSEEEIDEAAQAELATLLKNAMFRK